MRASAKEACEVGHNRIITRGRYLYIDFQYHNSAHIKHEEIITF